MTCWWEKGGGKACSFFRQSLSPVENPPGAVQGSWHMFELQEAAIRVVVGRSGVLYVSQSIIA